MKGRWKDYERQVEHCQRIGKLSPMKFKRGDMRTVLAGRKGGMTSTREHLSKMGQKSRLHENEVAKKIKSGYDYLFLPNEICDRIGFKDGKVTFIEIKSKRGKLTEKQKAFQSLVSNYIIVA